MRKNLKNQSGFTLIELVLVISIIGILSMMILPKFEKYQEISKIYTHKSNVKILKSAGYMCMIDNSEDRNIELSELETYLDDGVDLKVDPIIKEKFSCLDQDKYSVSILQGKVIVTPGSEVENREEDK